MFFVEYVDWFKRQGRVARLGISVLFVFGTLYLANSYGIDGAYNAAIVVGLAAFVWYFGRPREV